MGNLGPAAAQMGSSHGPLDPAPAIQVRDLSFSYEDKSILEDLTFQIPPEQFTVLLGKNGSGKSTLLRILTGLLDFRQGAVSVMGQELRGLSSGQRARIIGFLPQQHRAVFPFVVRDVVLTGRASYVRLVPGIEDEDKVDRALERVGITHLAERPFTELSGGEQQMVMIARVLAQESKIIMLDEPTSHLDFVNQSRLLSLVRELVDSGLTVLAVLHDPNGAFLYGDHFVFLRDGRLEELAEGESAWDRQVLERIYDADLQTIPHGERAIVVPRI